MSKVTTAPKAATATANPTATAAPVVETATATAAPAAKPEPTSEKLVELKAKAIAAWKLANTFDDPFAPEAKNARLEFLKLDGEIKAELSNIAKLENDAKIAEAKNQRLALVANLLTAYDASKAEPTNTDLESAYKTAREAVENELLAKYAGSKPATATANGESNAGRNTESKAAILEAYHAGKTNAEIEAMGFARSTVWHTINNYKKANATA